MRDRVVETEHISMETKPSYGVIAVSVLDVTADRVPQVGTVAVSYTHLTLPTNREV